MLSVCVMLLVGQRHELLLADRSRDVEMIRTAIDKVMADNPDATLLDCEMAFRDAAANTYLVMDEEGTLHIVFGMQAWRAALIEIGKRVGSANHARLLQSERVANGQGTGAA